MERHGERIAPAGEVHPPSSAPAADPAATPLRAARLVWLDPDTAERLSQHGVHDLRSLIELASLALARRAGVPYAKLLDLACQARRALGESLHDVPPGPPSPAEGAPFELRPAVQRGGLSREGLAGARSLEPAAADVTAPARSFEQRARPWAESFPASVPEDPGPAGPFV
jgi:hypothetical protein